MSPRGVDGHVPYRSSAWLSLSAALHGVAWLALARHDFAPRANAPPTVLEFQLLTPPEHEQTPTPTVLAAAEVAEPAASTPPHASPPERRSSAIPASEKVALPRPAPPRAVQREVESQATEPNTTLTPKPSASAEVPSEVVVPPSDTRVWSTLDPRAAALTVVDPKDQGPAQTAEQKLNDAIVRGATRPNEKRPEPRLMQGPNGGYVYKGHGFEATIASNGDLTMKDRFGSIAIPFVPFQTPDGSWRIAIIGGTFGLYEWLDRKFGKNDPYLSERRWFLERTRALRERLARQHAPGQQREVP